MNRIGAFALVVLLAACGEVGVGLGGGVTTVPTSTCPSGTRWSGGNAESPLMNPGQACIECHTSSREGPRFLAAGTVYSDFNEANDCGGSQAAGLTVVLTDSAGTQHSLSVNSMGNFYLQRGTLPLPYSAKVIDGAGHERLMAAKQMSGDCNSCHTSQGAEGAPGRIVAP